MEIRKVPERQISERELVTVTRMNHVIEVQHMEKCNKKSHIKKLDAERYMDIETGEIKEFDRTETRAEGLNSLRQTFKKLRYLINNNFIGAPNELFITLTFRGDLQTNDHIRVGEDYKNFLKRLKYAYKDQATIEAIKVLEPHQSGNWHMHVLLRFDGMEKIFIENERLAEIWGNGFVQIQSLKDVDNIGAYVSAYLTDIEVTADNVLNVAGAGYEVKEHEGKYFAKGARLAYYRSGVNIYSKTKGIKYPERVEMSYKQAKKIVGAGTPHYKKSIAISDDEIDCSNTITYEQYNLKR